LLMKVWDSTGKALWMNAMRSGLFFFMLLDQPPD